MRGALFNLFGFITGSVDLVTLVISLFSVFVIIFLCFPVREWAHAFVAHLLGDNTAAEQGRLTLNPLAHIDPLGAICMAICSIGWGKPTPINLHRCRKVSVRTAAILVALAGPVANILMALVFVIISKIIMVTAMTSMTTAYVYAAMLVVAQINTYLAVLNLLPIPPFDGYTLIQGILPRKQAIWVEGHAQILNMIVFVMLVSGLLSVPLGYASDGILWVLDKITFFIH